MVNGSRVMYRCELKYSLVSVSRFNLARAKRDQAD